MVLHSFESERDNLLQLILSILLNYDFKSKMNPPHYIDDKPSK